MSCHIALHILQLRTLQSATGSCSFSIIFHYWINTCKMANSGALTLLVKVVEICQVLLQKLSGSANSVKYLDSFYYKKSTHYLKAPHWFSTLWNAIKEQCYLFIPRHILWLLKLGFITAMVTPSGVAKHFLRWNQNFFTGNNNKKILWLRPTFFWGDAAVCDSSTLWPAWVLCILR